MQINSFSIAAVLAMVLAFGLSLRVSSQNNGFRREVNQSLATTEGYDQKFIDMVDHLEDVLTTRASFAYPGGRDPISGRRREVASIAPEAVPKRAAANRNPSKSPKPASGRSPQPPKLDSVAAPPPDRVKLTAIIADDYGQHTAIVMDGERSLSVDVGDSVGARKVTRITNREITMEDGSAVYIYDLAGNRNYQQK